MKNSENKAQDKPSPFRTIWPDVKTEKGQKDAIKAGALALCCLMFFYVFLITMMLLRNAETMKAFADESEFVFSLAVSIAAIPFAGLLAWLIFKKQSLIAASIGLVWIAAEVVMKLMAGSGSKGAVLAVLVLLYSVNGLRGALATRKAKQLSVV